MIRKISNYIFNKYFSNQFYYNQHVPYRISEIIKSFEIDQIFDIGANIGQFASKQFELGFSGEIVSFEPISTCHAKLQLDALKKNNKWVIAERMALGSNEGFVKLNISENLESSSILQMTSELEARAPQAKFVRTEEVPMKILDKVFSTYNTNKTYMLKLDVQGSEYDVIQGGIQTVKNATIVLLELPFSPSYLEEKDFTFICSKMKELNFYLHSVYPAYTDNSRFIHVDTVFVNNKIKN